MLGDGTPLATMSIGVPTGVGRGVTYDPSCAVGLPAFSGSALMAEIEMDSIADAGVAVVLGNGVV